MASIKLTPVLKTLLTLKRPQPVACPPLAKLHALFDATLAEAQQHNAPRGWLVLSTSALVSSNVPEGVSQLYRYTTANKPFPERVEDAELMREAALKCIEFIGAPRSIISLTSLHGAIEDEVKTGLRTKSLRTIDANTYQKFTDMGRQLWDSVYEPHQDKLLAKLGSFHPDFPAFIIQSYGNLLAPVGTAREVPGTLGRALTSVLGAAALRAEEGVGPQLVSHVFGLLKARGWPGETEEDKWLTSDEGAEWVLRTTDRITELVRGGDVDIRAKL
ncbi:hypothetical protein EXIGLDRAFT_600231 [Exidia glandulosa HHB12029]|uniref:Dol-P-Man:Man(5)GlcNAc(2)-PP-Dol alpha-1,3-mannosyltransferase n=1 Tax=Exidia glandulosa HHB12029 TaxID=1314781 RepID=A0A165QQ27_EXIGL|nr:hypothetical protein EXIGLDRAFT_600231 [Exidia glandulosa HHB12029]